MSKSVNVLMVLVVLMAVLLFWVRAESRDMQAAMAAVQADVWNWSAQTAMWLDRLYDEVNHAANVAEDGVYDLEWALMDVLEAVHLSRRSIMTLIEPRG